MRSAAVALLLLTLPAAAEERIEANEPLVMRLVFDECLGFARDGKAPFEGLTRGPVPADVLEGLGRSADFVGRGAQTCFIVSSRYVAIWGLDDWRRAFCTVQTPYDAEGPRKLGVDPRGFLQRVAERARREGLTEIYGADERISPLVIPSYNEPGEKEGELSFSLTATTSNADGSLVDVGLIMMGGRLR